MESQWCIGSLIETPAEKADDKDKEGDKTVKHNVFEGAKPGSFISHDDMKQIFKDAKKLGSLRDAFNEARETDVLAHANDARDVDSRRVPHVQSWHQTRPPRLVTPHLSRGDIPP